MSDTESMTPTQVGEYFDKMKPPKLRENAASLSPLKNRADIIKKRRKAERNNKQKSRK